MSISPSVSKLTTLVPSSADLFVCNTGSSYRMVRRFQICTAKYRFGNTHRPRRMRPGTFPYSNCTRYRTRRRQTERYRSASGLRAVQSSHHRSTSTRAMVVGRKASPSASSHPVASIPDSCIKRKHGSRLFSYNLTSTCPREANSKRRYLRKLATVTRLASFLNPRRRKGNSSLFVNPHTSFEYSIAYDVNAPGHARSIAW